MLNLIATTLEQVVANAKHMAAGDARWQNAIDRAASELAANPYIERQAAGGLLLASPSGQVYSTSTSCGCTAAAYGRPCWHRAAARLVARYDERQAQQTQPRRPLFAEYDAETVRLAAKGEMRAQLEEQAAKRAERIAAAQKAAAELLECF